MRRHKYGATKQTVDGIIFHSKAEARRYGELKLLERAGQIRALELQPRYPIEVSGKLICTYVADFRYRDTSSGGPHGRLVIEDVKGYRTKEYAIKRKLFEAVYGLTVTEVTRRAL